MLPVLIVLPLLVAAGLLAAPAASDRVVSAVWTATTGVLVALVAGTWVAYRLHPPAAGGQAFVVDVAWIPSVGSRFHLGVDGLSLPLVALTAVLFLAAAVHAGRRRDNLGRYAALMLFLQSASLGVFVALDLLVFFVFFDLSIVGMYFVIAGWGQVASAERRRAALLFFLYTFAGSLALLLGFIGLYLAADPHTFDMVELARANPLAGRGVLGGIVLGAVLLGLAIKTPTFPFHTWLPPAHTSAPAEGSAILAGVLLKMGTYGFLRIAMPLLPQAWRAWAWVIVVIGVISVLHGALVALAQDDLKRMVAYTSVNHMGYIVLAVGAAGLGGGADEAARSLAVTGAVTQMVSHGLITGALFLLCGVLHDRGGTYAMSRYGGLAGVAPVFTALFAVAAFASLGLPGLSGFVAELQIFTGSLATAPVPTAVAVLGIVVTAALFLRALGRLGTGSTRTPDGRTFGDVTAREVVAVVPLLVLVVVLGVYPSLVLDVISPAAGTVVQLVGR
ncbi:NADH-quinone oxidoreductase subunit M [Rhodococcus antarcticus]|uniref:NADH-quinone oxidoreductase subunit M n=1 Tax=Rhodococcus antarcticus TaxID=2987751 RepID=A0ABY6P5F1_9NOCA|nr:NADH-quinone oxidoreductase subunit M [Rhodococcus antarcticus]UZJ26571.1 NADH-quinone oxidoreductase subunit M [Rhodococcus antarcticus]